MNHLNIFMLLSVSMPEAILTQIAILRLTKNDDKLDFRKWENILKFLLCTVINLINVSFIRPASPNVAINAAFNSIAYIIVFSLIYGINYSRFLGKPSQSEANPVQKDRTQIRKIFLKFLLAAPLQILFIAIIEGSYIPFIINYFGPSLSAFFDNVTLVFLCTIPIRIVQIIEIKLIPKFRSYFDTIDLNKDSLKYYVFSIYCLLGVDTYFSFELLEAFNSMSFIRQIAYSISLAFLIIIVFFLISRFYYSTAKIIKNGYKWQLKLKLRFYNMSKELAALLKDGKTEEMEKILNEYIKEIEETKEINTSGKEGSI